MKKVVLLSELNTSNIISHSLYKEYVKLLAKDTNAYFLKTSCLVDIACPGCGKKKNKNIYKKVGMNFKMCSECGSHYVSPRPNPLALEKFYRDSKACRYWRKETLYLPKSQLYYIYGPRVNWVSELVDELLPDISILLDLQTKYPYFLKHLIKDNIFKSVLTFEPQLFEQIGLLPDPVVVVNNLNNYWGKISILTAFESLERMFDPGELFALASNLCKSGGLLLITTASCSGFEYQILGENASNINPINRMNLLSMEALTDRIKTAGFEIIEFSTPGRLDAEIVRQAIKESDNIQIDPFWKYIFEFRDEKTWHKLQNFLQVNRLSSHVRIAAKKKDKI